MKEEKLVIFFLQNPHEDFGGFFFRLVYLFFLKLSHLDCGRTWWKVGSHTESERNGDVDAQEQGCSGDVTAEGENLPCAAQLILKLPSSAVAIYTWLTGTNLQGCVQRCPCDKWDWMPHYSFTREGNSSKIMHRDAKENVDVSKFSWLLLFFKHFWASFVFIDTV